MSWFGKNRHKSEISDIKDIREQRSMNFKTIDELLIIILLLFYFYFYYFWLKIRNIVNTQTSIVTTV